LSPSFSGASLRPKTICRRVPVFLDVLIAKNACMRNETEFQRKRTLLSRFPFSSLAFVAYEIAIRGRMNTPTIARETFRAALSLTEMP
jgi:hypothetical protein